MDMQLDEIFQKLRINKDDYKDLHITRKFFSFVAISNGEVIAMTDPWMEHCLLFDKLNLKKNQDDFNKIRQVKCLKLI